ncbi:hypothetical protein SAMN04487948_101301 [Halogranum amylolyticum]|uniref:CAAX prenyl protease 2/Lysostaphin resistance protein A-like domain-containing protein n=1 Tax=Halogranum amylolyticum TaxID=660520 RepID=A0A1H8N4E8_9EURY|nr:CPBP family intramembrane glutamic endopeptidase [Halogranum amylolyticum]SEO24464.1 hypothetical protein SAMN04487948_101301 [Halogranum amylolyticum]
MSNVTQSSKLRALGVGVGAGLAGILVSLVLVLAVATGIQLTGVQLSAVATIVVMLFVNQYLSFGGVALGYLQYRGLSLDYIGVRVPSLRDLLVVFGGYLAAFGLVTVAGVVIQALGTPTAQNTTAQMAQETPEILFVLIPASFLIIGPGEEILFRGIVQRRLREAFSPAPAIVISATLFAVIHYVALSGPSAARFTTIAILFFPSLVFGAAYEYTNNIVVPSLIHGAYNATLFSLLYVVITYGPSIEQSAAMLL